MHIYIHTLNVHEYNLSFSCLGGLQALSFTTPVSSEIFFAIIYRNTHTQKKIEIMYIAISCNFQN